MTPEGDIARAKKIFDEKDRLGHDLRYSIDSSKGKELGWKPERDFESELKDTIDWYRENASWWRRLKGSG